jgi:hypothetical protein
MKIKQLDGQNKAELFAVKQLKKTVDLFQIKEKE